MLLEIRRHCERCKIRLEPDAPAFTCHYECTFCRTCAVELLHICPNCGGALMDRLKRIRASSRDSR